MTNDLQDITRKAAVDIGNRIVDVYPDFFTVKYLSAGPAGASLGQKIYHRIHYRKHDHNESSVSK